MNNQLYISNFARLTSNALKTGRQEVILNEEQLDFRDFLKMIYRMHNTDYAKFFKMDYLSKLGFITTELLLKHVELIHNPENVALVFFNSQSTIPTDQDYLQTVNKIPSPAVFVYTLPNIVMGEISIRNGFRGENLFLVEKGFNAVNLFNQIEILFSSTDTSACICGWVDYVSKNSYNAILYLVERVVEQQNCIIFNPKNIELIFKGEM